MRADQIRHWRYFSRDSDAEDVTDGVSPQEVIPMSSYGWLSTGMECSTCGVVAMTTSPLETREQRQLFGEYIARENLEEVVPDEFGGLKCFHCDTNTMKCVLIKGLFG